jgi:hypothetical protein
MLSSENGVYVYNFTTVPGSHTYSDNRISKVNNVTVNYIGNQKAQTIYADNVNSTTFIVEKLYTPINITVEDITLGENASVTVQMPLDINNYYNPEGNEIIEVYVDTRPESSDSQNRAVDVNGKYSTQFADLTTGVHTVYVRYPALHNSKYRPNNTASYSFNVNKLKTDILNVTVDPNPYENGGKTNITIDLPENTTGNVTIKVGNETFNGTINSTTGNVTIPIWGINQTNGTNITIIYPGDDNNTNSTEDGVIRPDGTVKLYPKIFVRATDSIIDGTTDVYVEVPSRFNGQIIELISDGVDFGRISSFTINNDGKLIGNTTFAVINSGNISVKAVIRFDTRTDVGRYLSSLYLDKHYNSTTFFAEKRNLTINATTADITYGETLVINVTLPNNAIGSVGLYENGNFISSEDVVLGDVQFNINNRSILTGGMHNFTIKFNGDHRYNSNETTVVVVVNKKWVNITVDVSKSPIGIDENQTVVVGLPAGVDGENITGYIVVQLDDNNTYSYPINNLTTVNIPIRGNEFKKDNVYNITVFLDSINYESINYTSFTVIHVDPTNLTEIVIEPVNITASDNIKINVTLPEDATGNVTIHIGNETFIVPVVNGTANLDVPLNNSGDYNVTIDYSGDNKYNSTSWNNITNIHVNKFVNYNINASDVIINYGENAIVKVNVPKDLKVDVKITIENNGKILEFTNKSVDGVATFDISDLVSGVYNVTMFVENDPKYDNSTNKSLITVKSIDTKMDVTSDNISVGENATVVVKLNDDATGTVSVIVDGKTYTGTVDKGSVEISVPGLLSGNHTADVVYSGDNKYNPNSSNVTIKVSKVDDYEDQINITIPNLQNTTAGDDIVIEIDVPDDIKKINVTVDNKTYEVDVIDGKANVTISNITKGNHTIDVDVPGDDKYDPVNKTITIDIPPADLNITIDDPIVDEGEDIIINFPPDATGNVTIDIGGKNITVPVINGTAIIPTKDIPSGVYNNTTITYSGDDKYPDTEINSDLTIRTSKYDIKISTKDINVGETERITLELPNDINGNVIVEIAGKNYTVKVTNGKGSVDIRGLLSNNYTVTASFAGNNKYLPKSNSSVFAVNKINPKMDIKNTTVIENGTIIIDFPEDATGNVTVKIGNKTIVVPVNNGTAIIPIDDLPEGNYTANITYSGDDKYSPMNYTVDIVVEPKIVDDYQIIIDAQNINVGQAETIKITLPKDINGVVILRVGNKAYNVNIVNGEGSITINDLVAGTYSVSVNYAGDDKYVPKSNDTSFKVSANASIDINSSDIIRGDDLVIDFPEDATGNVTVIIGNKTYNVPIIDGKVNIPTDDLEPGNYTAIIIYPGDDKYAPFNKTVNITIESRIIISAYDLTKYYHGPEKFVAYVVNSEGKALSNYVLKVTINGVSYTRYTNATGYMNMNINLNSGIYNVSVVGGNGYDNATITVLPTVNGTDIVKVFRNGTQYYATFRDSNGDYLANGTEVEFNINGIFYKRYISGDKGLAKLNINLAQGDYIITARNIVTGEKCSNNITVISLIINGKDLVKHYRNNTQYVVQILATNGQPAGAGESVRFNINGVFYTRTSNATGHVKLNINLIPDDYIVTAEYNDCKISNNVKVLPLLYGDDLTKYYRNDSQYVVQAFHKDGNPAGAGEAVNYNINGVFYTRYTNATGHAVLNINLEQGDYVSTAQYLDYRLSNNIKVLPVLFGNDLTKRYGSSDAYQVKLVDGQGKALDGKTVTFNINGVFYNRTTDSNGVAKLNINLMPGEHVITASYGDIKWSNTIRVN